MNKIVEVILWLGFELAWQLGAAHEASRCVDSGLEGQRHLKLHKLQLVRKVFAFVLSI